MKQQQHYEIEIFKLGFGNWYSRVYIVHPNPFADPIRTAWFTRNTSTKWGAQRAIARVFREEEIIAGEPTVTDTVTPA
jgi:hypothetical protein